MFDGGNTEVTPLSSISWTVFVTSWGVALASIAFGSRAANCLSKKDPDARIVLVDSDSDTLREWEGQVGTVLADGIFFLVRHLDNSDDAIMSDWIVPAIPVHVAFE